MNTGSYEYEEAMKRAEKANERIQDQRRICGLSSKKEDAQPMTSQGNAETPSAEPQKEGE